MRSINQRHFALAAFFCSMFAWGSCIAAPANGHAEQAEKRPLTASCIYNASKSYGIHQDILYAILMVEGGTVGQDSKKNKNGSYDIGPFQLNSIHRSTFEAMGVSEDELRDDGCTNALAAAWQLKRVLTPDVLAGIKTQDDYLSALARYHSVTPEYNQVYAGRLKKAFERIYASDSNEPRR